MPGNLNKDLNSPEGQSSVVQHLSWMFEQVIMESHSAEKHRRQQPFESQILFAECGDSVL